MKSLKYITLVGLLCAGLASVTSASINQIADNLDIGNAGDQTELDTFLDLSSHPDADICAKIEVPATTDPESSFNISAVDNGDGTVTVSFDLTGTGFFVCGFSVKDGSGTIVSMWEVDSLQGVSGSFTVDIPGQGALSHTTVFCCPGGVTTPDGGATVMLLGAGLGALGLVRRYLKS
jgi:hypothetical protein